MMPEARITQAEAMAKVAPILAIGLRRLEELEAAGSGVVLSPPVGNLGGPVAAGGDSSAARPVPSGTAPSRSGAENGAGVGLAAAGRRAS